MNQCHLQNGQDAQWSYYMLQLMIRNYDLAMLIDRLFDEFYWILHSSLIPFLYFPVLHVANLS